MSYIIPVPTSAWSPVAVHVKVTVLESKSDSTSVRSVTASGG